MSDMKWFVHQFTGISLKVYHVYTLKTGAAEGGIEVGDGEKVWNIQKINAIKFVYQQWHWQLQCDLYKHS
jgi:hypothetical protein